MLILLSHEINCAIIEINLIHDVHSFSFIDAHEFIDLTNYFHSNDESLLLHALLKPHFTNDFLFDLNDQLVNALLV